MSIKNILITGLTAFLGAVITNYFGFIYSPKALIWDTEINKDHLIYEIIKISDDDLKEIIFSCTAADTNKVMLNPQTYPTFESVPPNQMISNNVFDVQNPQSENRNKVQKIGMKSFQKGKYKLEYLFINKRGVSIDAASSFIINREPLNIIIEPYSIKYFIFRHSLISAIIVFIIIFLIPIFKKLFSKKPIEATPKKEDI